MKISEGVTRRTLDNGLTVLIKENHNSPVVAIFTHVKAGYFNESDDVAGISHLIEHMFFKGTMRRGVGQIAAETKMLGGYLNASTIYDQTLYYTVLPGDSFVGGLDIQSDALINSVFSAKELNKETEVVIQESKRKLDTPSAVCREKLFELAFSKHRMRRWRIGTEAGLRALTRDDFLKFYHDHYRPENIILSIVGDVQTEEAIEQVEKYYGSFQRGILKKENSPPEPTQTEFRSAMLKGVIENSYLAIGFHTPENLHEDTYALEILSFILGYGRSSRLNQNVKEAKQLVNNVTAYNYALPELGMFVIEATTTDDKIRDAEEAILLELRNIDKIGVTDAELEKARNLLEASYIMGMQSVSGQASLLADYEALGDFHMLESYLDKLYQVNADDLSRVLNKYFHRANCSLLEYLPEASSQKPVEAHGAAKNLPEQSTVLTQDLQAATNNVEAPFQISSGKGTADKPAERVTLANGVTLIAKQSGSIPIISCGVFTKGGRNAENKQNCGISGLMARTAMKGTQQRDARTIATAIENLGSSIQFTSQADYFSTTMAIQSKHFAAGWDILTDILTAPSFPKEEIEHEKKQTLARIRQQRDDMFRYPLNLYYSSIFAGHPYGLPALGTEETIQNMTREWLVSWHQSKINREEMVVVFVGDFETDRIINKIETGLQRLAQATLSRATVEPCLFHTNVNPVIENKEKEQTAIVMGFPGPRSMEADIDVLTVLQNILSGLGGRFFEELRGRQSLAYTVSAYLAPRFYGGTFLSYIATSPENEQKARHGLREQFKKLTHELVSDEELQRSIQFTTGTHRIGLETYQSQMFEYAHNELSGMEIEEVHDFPKRIRKVTKQDILQAAGRYFSAEKCAEGILRGQSAGKKN